MTVYIDQFIIINTILNFIILYITKSIIKSKSSNPRLLVSSITGALFAILMLFPQVKPLTNIFGKIIFSLIITGISFKSSSFKTYLKNLSAFYLVSFTTGGCAYAFINLVGSTQYTDTAKLLCITVFLSYVILNVITSVYEKHFKYGSLIHKLSITLNDKTIETECFYDTGNNLKDPITKKPVIIVNRSTVKKLLPAHIAYQLTHETDIMEIYTTYFEDLKLKIIPYRTITEKGFILGFVPSEVLIDGEEKKAIIGISSSVISDDKSYNAIVNPNNI